MEQKNTHIMYGLGSGIIMVLIAVILHIAKMDDKPLLGWLAYIPFLVGMILNAVAFSKANDGYITFKSAFGSCFKATMIVAIFMVAYTVITLYMFPEIKEMSLAKAREEMLKQPGMSDDKIDLGINMARKMYGTILVSGAVAGTLFMGAIFSLIGAGVAPKKGERPIGDNF